MNKKNCARLFWSNTHTHTVWWYWASEMLVHNSTQSSIAACSHSLSLPLVLLSVREHLQRSRNFFSIVPLHRHAQIFVMLAREWILFTDQNANYYWSRFYIARKYKNGAGWKKNSGRHVTKTTVKNVVSACAIGHTANGNARTNKKENGIKGGEVKVTNEKFITANGW